jgi:ADP-heptose:LPS heptosyltransferase
MNDQPDTAGRMTGRDQMPAFGLPQPGGIAWVDGDLFRFLPGPRIMDIKAPGDPDLMPVARGATVATHLAGTAESTVEISPADRYNSIFSRYALGFSERPDETLARWFAALLPGGYLVFLLPHGGSALANVACRATPVLGARRAAPRKEWDTVPAVRAGIERALAAGGFRIVLADAVPARRLAGFSARADLEIRVVVQKLEDNSQPAPPIPPPLGPAPGKGTVQIPFRLPRRSAVAAPGLLPEGDLLVRDFSPKRQKISRILVLKLDHHGDFAIGLPALRELRETFAHAHIRLVCGSWNVATAEASGVADEVRSYNFFPERGPDWAGKPVAELGDFDEAAGGRFDLAIDLRVDEDTRVLLGRVDAEFRCGIGSQSRFPMMQIALPDPERANTFTAPLQPGAEADADIVHVLMPDAFQSSMRVKTAEFHETEFLPGRHTVLRSAEVCLPAGRYAAEFDLTLQKFMPGLAGVGLYLEVIDGDGRSVAKQSFGRRTMVTVGPRTTSLHFNSAGEPVCYRFQVITEGKAFSGKLRFRGVRVRQLDEKGPRFQPSELHVGEKLSLLVALIRQRVLAPHIDSVQPVDRSGAPGEPVRIVIAPFSNSAVRDWPRAQYAQLMAQLTERYDCRIQVVGSPAQTASAEALMASACLQPCADRVINLVGKTQWSEMRDIILGADLVICNNSGIAHQAAALGARTLAIYSGSHQPMEWGPRGPRSRAIMMGVPCSPCGFERIEDCKHDHACMTLMTPEMVFAQVSHLLRRDTARLTVRRSID